MKGDCMWSILTCGPLYVRNVHQLFGSTSTSDRQFAHEISLAFTKVALEQVLPAKTLYKLRLYIYSYRPAFFVIMNLYKSLSRLSSSLYP